MPKEPNMNYVGIDLHKQSISICVVDQSRKVVNRKRFSCARVEQIETFFRESPPFEAVVEATASYEWLFQRLEPLSQRMILAHPGKLRVIAESTRKSDKLDAQVLAEFLAMDMIPMAHRPTPRQREHRRLVRRRNQIKQQITRVRTRIRFLLADYNADRKDLFHAAGLKYLRRVSVSPSDRFVLDQLAAEWEFHDRQLGEVEKALQSFANSASGQEAEARALLDSIPYVGPVTVDVVRSELGDVRRFRSQKQVVSYAGLAPGYRESSGKRKDLGITKKGSGLLRWALIESAWRLVFHTARWRAVFDALAKRCGRKRAITAVARRLLCVMVSMLKSGRRYQPAMV
jgi:transposase